MTVLMVNCGTGGDHSSGIEVEEDDLPAAMLRAEAANDAADTAAMASWQSRHDAQVEEARLDHERAVQQRMAAEPLVAIIQERCGQIGCDPAIVALAKLMGIVPME
jgi:hypothetical protein